MAPEVSFGKKLRENVIEVQLELTDSNTITSMFIYVGFGHFTKGLSQNSPNLLVFPPITIFQLGYKICINLEKRPSNFH